MQNIALVVFALVAVVAGKSLQYVEWFEMKPANTVPYLKEWESFKRNHGKEYVSKEVEQSRLAIFRENMDYIAKHNAEYDVGKKSYYLGVNQFADMEVEEFRAFNGLWRQRNRSSTVQCSPQLTTQFELLTLPDEVDWRKQGYVTAVKNQGQCGSCWSFSTTGSLEGQHFRKTGKLISLSEQQLVDCSGKFGNEGCNGGLMDQAFEYVIQTGGIESEEEYSYHPSQGRCRFNKSEVVATCIGCVDVKSESEDDLKAAVGIVGPVSVAIDASHRSFQLYKGGVYDEPECSKTELDHGVLTVGYGTEDGQHYWLVKNSWGTTWGEEGYVKMTRNNDNQCGIATQASYPKE